MRGEVTGAHHKDITGIQMRLWMFIYTEYRAIFQKEHCFLLVTSVVYMYLHAEKWAHGQISYFCKTMYLVYGRLGGAKGLE